MGQINIVANGQVLTISSFTATLYTDAAYSSSVTLPAVISADTTYYARAGVSTMVITQGDGTTLFSNSVSVQDGVGNVAVITPLPTSAQSAANGSVARAVNAVSWGAGVHTIDASLGEIVEITLTASTGQLSITNPKVGQRLFLTARQTGAGSFLVTWPTNFRWAANTAPTLTTAAGRQDNFLFRYDGTNWVEFARTLNTLTA